MKIVSELDVSLDKEVAVKFWKSSGSESGSRKFLKEVLVTVAN